MLKELSLHGSWLPTALLVFFSALFVLVLLYVLTDRRRQHRARMESLALDEPQLPLPHAEPPAHVPLPAAQPGGERHV